MMVTYKLLLFCASIIATTSEEDPKILLKSPNGIFKGSQLISFLGKNIYSFRGIPYAEAPTGRNRFKQATLIKRYIEMVDATEEGPSCPQPVTDGRIISENCLTLNVYITKLPKHSISNDTSDSDDRELNDVIVFIHPGAFFKSSGTTFDFGPQILLDRNIILVTINYRLGALGFLSSGDERAPGNAGLKDQVLALRWIQMNIKSFGGNPDSVTLLGYGVGSWSVSLHIVSPMSEGLFHRAIAMSTLGTNQNQLPHKQDHLIIKQAQLLGCPTDTRDNIFECLYTTPAEDFGNSLPGFAEFFNDPILVWSPVIEVNCTNDNEEAFLVDQPFDIIRKKEANFVPFITGINKDELIGVVIDAEEQAQKGNTSMYNTINRNWDIYSSISLGYTREKGRAARISEEWRMDYLRNRPLGLDNYRGLAQVYADGLINFPVHRFERLMSEYSSESVFQYFYVYQGCGSFSKWSNGTNYGVVHKDELILLFKVRGFLPPCYKDWKTLDHLGRIIENFAKSGKPFSVDNVVDSFVEWKPSTLSQPKYLKIDEKLTMENGIIYDRRMKDWEDQFPLNPTAV